jgi:hypothetical protein
METIHILKLRIKRQDILGSSVPSLMLLLLTYKHTFLIAVECDQNFEEQDFSQYILFIKIDFNKLTNRISKALGSKKCTLS